MKLAEIIDEVRSNIRFAFKDVDNLPVTMFKREILNVWRDINTYAEIIRKYKEITTTSDNPNEIAFSDLTVDNFDFFKLIKIEYDGYKIDKINRKVYYTAYYSGYWTDLGVFYRVDKAQKKILVYNVAENKTLGFEFVAMPTMACLTDDLEFDDTNFMLNECLINGATYRMLKKSDKHSVENQVFLYNFNARLKDYKDSYYEGIAKLQKYYNSGEYDPEGHIYREWGI